MIQFQISKLPDVDPHHFLFETSRNIFTNDLTSAAILTTPIYLLGLRAFREKAIIRPKIKPRCISTLYIYFSPKIFGDVCTEQRTFWMLEKIAK